jgi:putative Mn2+ efflux pump MntP
LNLVEIVFIAFGLAMDAFAVSLVASGVGKIKNKRAIFRLSFHFGLFQFIMPILGWFAGANLEAIISTYDHWVALIKGGELQSENDPSKGYQLIILSLATSIDALAVGFSLAMIEINIWYPSAIIGIVTSSMALVGIVLGNHANQKLGKVSAIIGGIILSIIGFRILLSHL